MINWFNSREPRERVLLIILAGILAFMIAWFAITREKGPDGKAMLQSAQTDRALWLRASPKLNQSPSAGPRSDFSRGALNDVARRRGVDLSRVQPQAGGGVTVWMEDLPTTALYGLINDLVSNYAVEVKTATLSTAPDGGLNAQLTLTPL